MIIDNSDFATISKMLEIQTTEYYSKKFMFDLAVI